MCSITYGRAQTWDWEGIVHYELLLLLLPAKTIDSSLYCQDYNKPLKKIDQERRRLLPYIMPEHFSYPAKPDKI